jgi:hypothetical protein
VRRWGHLATVENLLHVVGGPLTLHREASPYAAPTHPFRLTLEPVTTTSLAKYAVAESHAVVPDELTDEDLELLAQIELNATVANGGQPVRHVGPIFARLAHLFERHITLAMLDPVIAARAGNGEGAPGATRDALLDLDRAQVAIGLVVGERYEVDHEAQDHASSWWSRKCRASVTASRGEGPARLWLSRMPAV